MPDQIKISLLLKKVSNGEFFKVCGGWKGKRTALLFVIILLQPLFIELLFDKVYIIPYTAFIHVICFIIYINQFIMYIID